MLLLCGALFMLSAISATAQMDAMFSGGAVRVGATATTCDANASGAIRYNATDKTIEYCNETEWTAFGSSSGSCGSSSDPYGSFDVTTTIQNASLTTVGGDTAISTSTKKYGAGSLSIGGSGSNYLRADNILTQNGDYTLEFWFKTDDVTTNDQTVIDVNQSNSTHSGNSPWGFFQIWLSHNSGSDRQLRAWQSINGSSWASSGVLVGTISANTWHHIAAMRSGNTTYYFLDGVLGGSTTGPGTATYVGSGYTWFAKRGRLIGGEPYYLRGNNNFIDDFKVTQGVAKYSTSGFTPPTAAVGCDSSGGGSSSGPDATTCNPGTYNATTGKCEFAYTGSDINWTVPAGVSSIDVKAWGAGGGRYHRTSMSAAASGGGGGSAFGTLSVTPGEVLTIVAGHGGSYGYSGHQATVYGGGAVATHGSGANGGGLSGIFTGSSILTFDSAGQSRALVVAGGGGGAGMTVGGTYNAGAGGGTIGQTSVSAGYGGAGGGTQSAGGAGVTGTDGANGSAGQNGAALMGGGTGNEAGGGGGGGYYGGGGGRYSGSAGSKVTGGGGGSGYIHPSRISSGALTVGNYATPANSSDADRGGAGSGATSGTDGGNGLVVIDW